MTNHQLNAAQQLTNTISDGIEKYLTHTHGNPQGLRGYLGSDPGYPNRDNVKTAINKIWEGLADLYRLDPHLPPWVLPNPFVSDADTTWLTGGMITPTDDEEQQP